MNRKRTLIIFLLLVILVFTGSCRKQSEESTPTPLPAAVDTPVPARETPLPEITVTATVPPTPTIVPLGLVPLENEGAVAPTVIGHNPAPGEEVALDGFLELYFDQPMNETATAGAWQLLDDEGTAVEGQVSWPQPRILRFKPARSLKPHTSYKMILADTAVSAEDVSLLEGLTLTFNTIGDLLVSQVSPAPGVDEVAIDSAITIIFNRPVVPLLIAEEQSRLPNPLETNPPIDGSGEWLNSSVYVFRPDTALIGRQRYSARVNADVVNEISASGALLAADYEWAFTVTAPTIQYLNLVDRTSSPSDETTDLPLDQPFQVIFSQPMDPASTEAAVSLVSDTGSVAPLTFSWQEMSSTLAFTPTQHLQLGTRYTLRVDDSARSAQGGRLRQGLTWHATTVQPPAIIEFDPGEGEVQQRFSGLLRINFASPMDPESLKGRVIVTPALSTDPDGNYDRWNWSLRFYGLAASTTYTVRVLPGMSDPYGNEISREQTVTFTTAPHTPMAYFNFPGQISLYRQGGSTAAWITSRNVDRLDVELYRITPLQFARLSYGGITAVDFQPAPADLIWSQQRTVSVPLNTRTQTRFDLAADTGALPPGFYFMTLDSPQVAHDLRHLQAQPIVMATANLTLKTTATEAMIWLTDLGSGDPIAGVPIAFYDENFDLIFRETSDSQGIVYRDDLSLETGFRANYYAVTEAADANLFGVAISGWNDGVNPYDFGIYTDYYLQPGDPTVYVYSDRPVYRPGQPVSFKGIVRLNDDLTYGLPRFKTVNVTVASFDENVFSESVPLSEYGSFATQFTLDEEASLGNYRITIEADGNWIGNGWFDVAEYRKPTFQVQVDAAEANVLAGETIRLTIDAQFFSGGSVVNGEVEWSVYASDYAFRAGGNLSRHSFSDDERDQGFDYYGGFYNPYRFIAGGEGRTDGEGRLTLEIPAELGDENGSQSFNIEASVFDIAGNQVSGRTSVVVHRSLIYPGVRSNQYVGQAGRELSFDVAMVNWDEDLVPDHAFTFAVVERRWHSVQEEDELGQTIWRSTVEEIPVLAEETLRTDSQGRASAAFVPPKGGVYRAIVSTRDSRGNETTASTYVWISGGDYVPWRRLNDHSFELVAGSDHYRPGDTAEILIASPFQGAAYALVTVERGHIKEYEVLELTSNSTIYRLPVTGEMAPNVFVSILVIKGVDETNVAPDFKVGMVQFTVEREQQELDLEISPDRASAGPGDEIGYTVSVKDHDGRPVDAEVSLALVDLAALSIAEPNASPILDHFYSERWLSVNTALLLTRLMDSFNQELEDEAKGGGGGGGEFGVISIRQDFPDTAYWEGQVRTGPDGEATVTVTLPDNLTTWRMDARAVTLDTKVGQATSDLVTTKPLLVSPNTPRFFVAGDKAVLGTLVLNNSESELEVMVTLEAEGLTLNSPSSQMVTIPAGEQRVVNWEAAIADGERVDLVFSASSGAYSDASRPMLATLDGGGIPVYKYEALETVGTSGQLMTGGAIVESISLPIFPDFELTEGEVTVELAPSLAAAMTDGLDYLEHYPHECTEQIVSRFLPNVLTSRALKAAGLNDPELEANLAAQVNIALQRLYSRQRSDGGWPWWDGPETSTLVTAYVVQALVEARDSGYQVSEGVIELGVRYLQDHLSEVDGLDGRYRLNRQAFLVYVLARAGKPSTIEINRLYEGRESLDMYAQGYLAQAIWLMDGGDPRLQTFTADFITNATLSATGASWEEGERDYWNWNSDTRSTAILLDSMIKLDPGNPLVANAVRWLMAHRTNGRWHSTQETAWSLMALTDWMVVSGELEADYQYEVALNGRLVGNGQASTESLRDSWKATVDIADLFSDELNRLAIGRSEGPGNLYYTTHLQASLPVEQVSALDRGIIISRSYFDPDDRETPITEIEQGKTFLGRLTIVVPNTLHYAVIEDFLPAGLEAVDSSLKTSQQLSAPQRYDWDDYFTQGWGWWYFDHVELRDEKVVISAGVLSPGTYEYVYLVRAATPGEYRVIPPTAQEFYFPEVYGRGEGSLFVVRSKS